MKSLFARLFGRAKTEPDPPSVPPAASGEQSDPIAILRERIETDVRTGFYDEDFILTQLGDYFEGEINGAVVRREAPRLLRAALAEHAAAEAHWPEITDCDRLDAAFAALEADGVIARQNFTCCMTCGSTEIWDEINAATDDDITARGYVFFHQQDTESAVEGHGLYFAYGACEDGEQAALTVARDVVAELESHGLKTDWDGSWNRRIGVALDWKKRRGVVRA